MYTHQRSHNVVALVSLLLSLWLSLWPALTATAYASPATIAPSIPAVQLQVNASPQATYLDVVISEIAWMGTTVSATAEWLELYNNTASTVDLTGWTLRATDSTPSITLSGSIPPYSYYLLERSSDSTIPEVVADLTYSGALSNDGENLELRDAANLVIDALDCSAGWFSGHADGRVPMVRVDTLVGGSEATNWTYNPRCGSPTNSAGISHTCTLTTTTVGTDLDYAVYFNPHATTAVVTTLEPTPMEIALLGHIATAASTIDVALYGLNRQSFINALIAAHNRGVTVRVVGDDEAALGEYTAGYQALISAGITVYTDTSISYIQHNKFIVIDGSVVSTGSTNFTDTGFTLNANNSIVITSTTLAGVYTTEFEEMWNGTFHNAKLDNTAHLLDFNGTLMESYFSPTDLVAFEVWDELAQTTDSVHFAMFFFTDDVLANRVVERLDAGVQVYGVWDQLGAANEASDDEALCAAGAHIGIENYLGKLHHKFAVLDVFGADPRVILGSYNWTDAGAYTNDENTLIIRDRALAEAYYAEWLTMWQTISPHRICNPLGVDVVEISGPVTGTVGQSYTFTATVNAVATPPVTYTWAATGQTPVVHSGQGLTDTVAFAWSVTGTQMLTVTAQNAWGQAVDTHWVTVTLPPPPPVLTVTLTGPVTGTVDAAYTFLATVNPTATLPLTYTWETTGQTPVVRGGLGLTDTVAWTWVVPGLQMLTVTVQNVDGYAIDTHAFAVEVAPTEVTIAGPLTGTVGTAHTFLATVNPTASLPLTYTWEATGQTMVVHSGQGLTDTVAFTWSVTGTQTITVTAQNAWGQAVDTHWVTVTVPPPPTLEVILSGPSTGAVDTAYTFLATVNSTLFLPLTYTWEASGQTPVVHPGQGLTDTVTFAWDTPGVQVITVTVANATTAAWDTHTLVLTLSDYFVYLPMVARDFSAPSPADVQITYIEYDPPGDDVQGEYVQIENLGGAAQEMTGWTLRDEANRVFTFPAFTLPTGGTVRVWTGGGTNTATDLYWGSGTAIWNNDGDTAYLRDTGGTLISNYTYP